MIFELTESNERMRKEIVKLQDELNRTKHKLSIMTSKLQKKRKK
jgi:hypothetical protein